MGLLSGLELECSYTCLLNTDYVLPKHVYALNKLLAKFWSLP